MLVEGNGKQDASRGGGVNRMLVGGRGKQVENVIKVGFDIPVQDVFA